MRPRVSSVLAASALLYLAVAIWPFQTETRLVGLVGSAIFSLLFAAEHRSRRRSRPELRSDINAIHLTDTIGAGVVERSDQWSTSAMLVLVAALGIAGLVLLARHDPVTTRTVSSQQANTAALAATRGGRATEVEVDTKGGAAWEVDVIKPDGTVVDVRLDRRFGLVAIEDELDGH